MALMQCLYQIIMKTVLLLNPRRMKYLATAQFPDAVYIYLNICPMLKHYTNLVE